MTITFEEFEHMVMTAVSEWQPHIIQDNALAAEASWLPFLLLCNALGVEVAVKEIRP